jgi:hypothetical protein
MAEGFLAIFRSLLSLTGKLILTNMVLPPLDGTILSSTKSLGKEDGFAVFSAE